MRRNRRSDGVDGPRRRAQISGLLSLGSSAFRTPACAARGNPATRVQSRRVPATVWPARPPAQSEAGPRHGLAPRVQDVLAGPHREAMGNCLASRVRGEDCAAQAGLWMTCRPWTAMRTPSSSTPMNHASPSRGSVGRMSSGRGRPRGVSLQESLAGVSLFPFNDSLAEGGLDSGPVGPGDLPAGVCGLAGTIAGRSAHGVPGLGTASLIFGTKAITEWYHVRTTWAETRSRGPTKPAPGAIAGTRTTTWCRRPCREASRWRMLTTWRGGC